MENGINRPFMTAMVPIILAPYDFEGLNWFVLVIAIEEPRHQDPGVVSEMDFCCTGNCISTIYININHALT